MISLRGIRSYQIGNGLSTKQYQYCVVADKENLLPITLLLTFRVYGGNPAKFIKDRFDTELKDLLLRFRWWDLEPEQLVEMLPLLCSPDLDLLKQTLRSKLSSR